MEDKIEKIINLIQQSPLDQTIQEILIRDLKTEGLTDFLREQINAYCEDGLKTIDEYIADVKKNLEDNSKKNPV